MRSLDGRIRLLAIVLASMVTLFACGGSDQSGDGDGDATASTDTESGGSAAQASNAAEVWEGKLDGAPTLVEIGVDPTDEPALGAVEAFRDLVGVDPIVYVRVTVENGADNGPNAAAYIDINGGDGLDPEQVIDFLCTDINFFWPMPVNGTPEEFDEAVAARELAAADLGCDVYSDEIAAGATLVYWLAMPPSEPTIESMQIRFNDFERR
ncbi:MAG: hypothetical protein P8N02_14365 [Actinomycetota bacterium]|jgi:hypothetical protein|nr:hypothetical protein [Actinomycetota bacterium]